MYSTIYSNVAWRLCFASWNDVACVNYDSYMCKIYCSCNHMICTNREFSLNDSCFNVVCVRHLFQAKFMRVTYKNHAVQIATSSSNNQTIKSTFSSSNFWSNDKLIFRKECEIEKFDEIVFDVCTTYFFVRFVVQANFRHC